MTNDFSAIFDDGTNFGTVQPKVTNPINNNLADQFKDNMAYFQAISRHKYEATPLPHPQQPEHKVPSNYQFLPAQKNLTHPEYRSLNLSSESTYEN